MVERMLFGVMLTSSMLWAASPAGASPLPSDGAFEYFESQDAQRVLGDVFEEIKVPEDFDSIQEAIDNAQAGNIITVAPGIYRENLRIIDKDLVIRSEAGPEATIIESGRRGGTVVFISQTTPAFTLRGFTITGGRASVGGGIRIEAGLGVLEDLWITGNEASEAGGISIHSAAPELRDVLIYENTALMGNGGGILFNLSSAIMTESAVYDNNAAQFGGGIHMEGAYPLLQDVTIEGNDSQFGGGVALVDSVPVISDTDIINNSAVDGGGMYAHLTELPTSPSLYRVRFEFNEAEGKGGGLYSLGTVLLMGAVDFVDNVANNGGGAFISTSVFTLLGNVRFSDNYANTDGGGLVFRSTDSAVISNLIFTGNYAERYGGGMNMTSANAGMTNLIFSGNYGFAGGGLYLYRAQPEISNCSIFGNRATGGLGGGIFLNEPSEARVSNSIFAYNRGSGGKENLHLSNGDMVTEYNDFYHVNGAGVSGIQLSETDMSVEPMVVNNPSDGNLFNDDYHLLPDSPLVDAGTPSRTENDPDGTRNDIGAYGGGNADRWDLDGDGYFQYWDPKTGYDAAVHDCDDLDETIFPGAGCED